MINVQIETIWEKARFLGVRLPVEFRKTCYFSDGSSVYYLNLKEGKLYRDDILCENVIFNIKKVGLNGKPDGFKGEIIVDGKRIVIAHEYLHGYLIKLKEHNVEFKISHKETLIEVEGLTLKVQDDFLSEKNNEYVVFLSTDKEEELFLIVMGIIVAFLTFDVTRCIDVS